MTYLYFHLVFILPAIGAVWYARRFEKQVELPLARTGIVTLAVIALIYTTPWDNYLVKAGIWGYGQGRVLESLVIGYVPIEEYLFFILQPIMTGTFFLLFAGRRPESLAVMQAPLERGISSVVGTGVYLLFAVFGVICLGTLSERFTYLGLILVWACPVLAFQWGYGGGTLWKSRKLLMVTVQFPTCYLWIVDAIAIDWRIWEIREATSTGWTIFWLPIEEAVFFLVTNLLVVQGLILFYQWGYGRRGAVQA